MRLVRLLLIGDVAGKPGLTALRRLVPRLVAEHKIDFVIANGENASGGIGIDPGSAAEILDLDIGCITTGNHIWRQREIIPFIKKEPRLLRPFNLPASQPGRGIGLFETADGVPIGVVNLIGRVFMDPAGDPFAGADDALTKLEGAKIIIVDFHAEATSEKRALGLHLAGRVTAVVGTHTHVPTADEQIIDGATAYLTDLGMTGPHDSVIGMRKDAILERFTTGMPQSFKLASGGIRLQGAIVEADAATGKATQITRIDLPLQS